MKFVKYNSIENSYQEKFLYNIRKNNFDKVSWVVTEKVHGAHVSFHYDGKEFVVGKRTSFIGSDETFYQANKILASYQPNLKQLFELVGHKEIAVHGEVFGGYYPNMNVNGAKKVQKGVIYCSDNEFIAFDLYVDNKVIPYKQALAYFETTNIKHAKPLFIGSFDEALNYPNEFDSLIPEQYGHEKVDNNICEGVVLKPFEHEFFIQEKRVILKNKNSKFSEVEKEKSLKVQMDDESMNLYNLFNSFVTTNRLDNVMSKHGEFTKQNIGVYLKELYNDAFEDFMKIHGDEVEKLDAVEKNKVLKVNKQNNSKMVTHLMSNY